MYLCYPICVWARQHEHKWVRLKDIMNAEAKREVASHWGNGACVPHVYFQKHKWQEREVADSQLCYGMCGRLSFNHFLFQHISWSTHVHPCDPHTAVQNCSFTETTQLKLKAVGDKPNNLTRFVSSNFLFEDTKRVRLLDATSSQVKNCFLEHSTWAMACLSGIKCAQWGVGGEQTDGRTEGGSSQQPL